MEITSKFKDNKEHQSPLNSPTTSTCSNTNNNGPHQPMPIPITRSDPNSPYPTTFVTADTSSFKQVVQMLTGSNEPASIQNDPITTHPPSPSQRAIPPIKHAPNKKQGFKLYERRNSLKNMISPLSPRNNINIQNHHQNNINNNNYHHFFNNNEGILSPSLLDFPSLTLSPVTPLLLSSSSSSEEEEEKKAIAEKGFYLHPSPRESKPQLLPLFPLSSPRMSDP